MARRTVVIVGWDLDSRVRLGPGAGDTNLVPPLRDFLPAVADKNPNLNIYILNWDFPFLFANVRDPALVRGRDPFNHPRVHFKFDDSHPAGASRHEKIVVVDDCLAFAGGMDVAGGRWDTSEHRAFDIRRSGKHDPYPPTHDVQAAVDGEAARALAEVVRERWHRSTGTSIPESDENSDIWPARVQPDVEDVFVGISRTDPGADGAGKRRDIEQLHVDLIDAARQSIYAENQYLTSATVVEALCRRLQEPDGPEVLIVLPLKNAGWLEENTIEVLRFRSMRRLREADRFRRLRLCYPVVPGLDGETVQVHSKVLVIDDRLFRVGSSNFTNRSMRLDTECDLTIEGISPRQRQAIARLRDRLLAEHLGLSADAVKALLAGNPSLIRLTDSRRTQPRSLREFQLDAPSPELLVDAQIIDPSHPVTARVVVESLSASAAAVTRRLAPAALVWAGITLALWGMWRALRATSRDLQARYNLRHGAP